MAKHCWTYEQTTRSRLLCDRSQVSAGGLRCSSSRLNSLNSTYALESTSPQSSVPAHTCISAPNLKSQLATMRDTFCMKVLGYLQNKGVGTVVLPDSWLISLLVELWYIVVYIDHVDPHRGVVKHVVTGSRCYDDQSMTSWWLVVK